MKERKRRGEEALVMVMPILVPLYLHSVVGNSGSYNGWGRRDVGYTCTVDAGYHHVMVG